MFENSNNQKIGTRSQSTTTDSLSITNGNGKQPLKRFEQHLYKFNDVAIPHHIDLLKKHKNNIQKFQENGKWDRVHHEQVNATRLIKQLKGLLYEMDILRMQVRDSDVHKFDKIIAPAQEGALKAMEDYLAMNSQQTNLWGTHDASPEEETEENKQINSGVDDLHNSQLKFSLSEEEMQRREQCRRSWENLHTEVQDVHDLFQEFAKVVEEQKVKVGVIEENVETTEENVSEGTNVLRKVSKYKASVYPLAGALIGGCLGGPIGLIAGVKLGGLAALGCGVLGFTGGRILKKKQEEQNNMEIEMSHMNNQGSMKGSVSLPHIKNFSEEDPAK